LSNKSSIRSGLYTDVIKVTDEFLGPAANRFISRKIANHLHKEPEELNVRDLKYLTNWIKIAMTLLVDDEKIMDRYMDSLRKLYKKYSK